jgi:L-asparagine transporter-like permease
MNFSWASTAMSVIILTAVLSCLNSAFYVCSRVLFLLAEHADAPQWLVQLNERRVPTRSVWIGAAAGVAGVLAATFAQQTVFAFLVNASGALMVFVYTMVAVAQVRLRRERERTGAPVPALQMWLFPWASYAAIVGMVAILVAMGMTEGQRKDLYFSLVALVCACVAYLVVRSRRARRSGEIPAAAS